MQHSGNDAAINFLFFSSKQVGAKCVPEIPCSKLSSRRSEQVENERRESTGSQSELVSCRRALRVPLSPFFHVPHFGPPLFPGTSNTNPCHLLSLRPHSPARNSIVTSLLERYLTLVFGGPGESQCWAPTNSKRSLLRGFA